MSRRVLPGFGLSLGVTLSVLALLVVLPLAALVAKAAGLSGQQWLEAAFSPRALSTYALSFGAALVASVLNAVFGLLVAWVLVRHPFPGRSVVDALVDLPFALPTAVAGIALTALYVPDGWVGRVTVALGLGPLAFTRAAVVLALVFVGFPFVVRTVQPALAELAADVEEAASTLGATRLQTFRRVVLPALRPALVTGMALAFARGVGEYGSIVFVSGNIPMRTEIAPLLIMGKLEQFDYAGASAIAVVMLAASVIVLVLLGRMQTTHGKGR